MDAGYRSGPLARIEFFGPLYAEFERKASEDFFCRFPAEPRPLFFGDPESGFYPRFPLRRPCEEVLRFPEVVFRFHHLILAQSASSRSNTAREARRRDAHTVGIFGPPIARDE